MVNCHLLLFEPVSCEWIWPAKKLRLFCLFWTTTLLVSRYSSKTTEELFTCPECPESGEEEVQTLFSNNVQTLSSCLLFPLKTHRSFAYFEAGFRFAVIKSFRRSPAGAFIRVNVLFVKARNNKRKSKRTFEFRSYWEEVISCSCIRELFARCTRLVVVVRLCHVWWHLASVSFSIYIYFSVLVDPSCPQQKSAWHSCIPEFTSL